MGAATPTAADAPDDGTDPTTPSGPTTPTTPTTPTSSATPRQLLGRLGIHRLGDLAVLPPADVLARFGWQGAFARTVAAGGDERFPGTQDPPVGMQVQRVFEEPVHHTDIVVFAARQLAEELAAALHHAREFAAWHDAATGGLRPVDVARARARRLAEAEGLREDDARMRLLGEAEGLVAGMRETGLSLACRPALVKSLLDRGASGRRFVEELRGRRDAPLLVLPAGAGD